MIFHAIRPILQQDMTWYDSTWCHSISYGDSKCLKMIPNNIACLPYRNCFFLLRHWIIFLARQLMPLKFSRINFLSCDYHHMHWWQVMNCHEPWDHQTTKKNRARFLGCHSFQMSFHDDSLISWQGSSCGFQYNNLHMIGQYMTYITLCSNIITHSKKNVAQIHMYRTLFK